jgi:hypothetical protein
MKILNILTVVHDNSITRLCIASDAAADLTQSVLETLGHVVEVGFGDVPQRDRVEMERLNALLDDIYNHVTVKMGIKIPRPPVQ